MNEDDDEIKTTNEEELENEVVVDGEEKIGHSTYKEPDMNDEDTKYRLSGMYNNWFLDYASYVIVQRAVPYIEDGLKPVQRRILHVMYRKEDGRRNKVATIVGETMAFHPHGDASIYAALIVLGQKNLLIDCQGNWGHIATGEDAAAGRYIEARLTKFALDVAFNPKVTEWKPSYDGRNEEPVTLPMKFPLLLAQGVSGVAVGLKTDILPHNFNELIDASISYLKGEDFVLYPDFQTGGMVDVSKYNDGARGGYVRVRSHISKVDDKTLVISDVPYGETTETIKKSIIAANDKGKINIKKIDDLTSDKVEIVVHLSDRTSCDKTMDALYALTKCEVKVWPCCCVLINQKPVFTNVKDVLRQSTDRTKDITRIENEIKRGELLEKLHFCSLEKIFIENRIYKDKEFEQAPDMPSALAHVTKRLQPFLKLLVRPITNDDVAKLMEIKMKRILKFSSDEADKIIENLNAQIEEINYRLEHLTEYLITWFEGLKEKYGKEHPRLTELKTFDNIQAAKVTEANEKLYINRAEGFVGYGLKKAEYICDCSDMDDIIVIMKDGKYKVCKVLEKDFFGKDILYVNVFKKNDKRTVYNVIYRDGKAGTSYIKRFSITGVTRGKEYDITQGTPGSRLLYFTANKNAEAETIQITLKPKLRLKVGTLIRSFADIDVKGRQAMGNVVTKNEIQKITLKSAGVSTMGGRKVWFDTGIQRLNYDEHGDFIGEFHSDDKILVITKKGEYTLTGFDDSIHFPEDLLKIEKFDKDKVWTVCLYDANEKYKYVKRFKFEYTNKNISFLGDNAKSELLLITDTYYPRLKLTFGGPDAVREPLEIEVDEFIGVKGLKAKGKRLHTWSIDKIVEIEPTKQPPVEEQETAEEPVETPEQPTEEPTDGSSDLLIDDNGVLSLF